VTDSELTLRVRTAEIAPKQCDAKLAAWKRATMVICPRAGLAAEHLSGVFKRDVPRTIQRPLG
jgi:hypothetical protein